MFLVLALLVQTPRADTSAFANEVTRALVVLAQARHGAEDQAVSDYRARFRYRLTFGFGRRRWALVPNISAEEQEGSVQWAEPNDLRVEIRGRRAAARYKELKVSSSFDRPWFIPRSLGDSIRVFGNEIPPRAALHPLAADGPRWYRYRVVDSLRFASSDGTPVRLAVVEVVPRGNGASLVTGRMWLDADRGDLVRLSFRFVGTELWLDPDDDEGEASARRTNRLVSRILTLDADLEYAFQNGRYWMPYRQVVSGRVELPWFGDLVVPFEAQTTFEDYELNTGQPIVFTVALPPEVTDPDSVQQLLQARRDSLREERRRRRREGGELPEDSLPRDEVGRWEGGRFEIHRAPGDSLAMYAEWGDSLTISDDPRVDREVRDLQSDLERMAVKLDPDLTGRRTHGFTWERIAESIRYNRVQGAAPRLGYELVLPGDGFTTARGEARFGLSDHRLTGELAIVREAPGARWTLSGYRDIRSRDPFDRGNGLNNSLNALFVGHDDADYFLSEGGRLVREGSVGIGLELTTTLLVERQRSVRREARSWLNDALGGTGDFPPNTPVDEGTFGGAGARLDGGLFRSRWSLGADVLGREGRATARAWGSVRRNLLQRRGSPVLAVRAGITTRDPLLQQAFRIGGLGTVRGFDYGTRGGQAFWAAQLDVPLTRGWVQPVLFADAGQADRAADLFGSKAIAGGGMGISILGGILRFDLSHPFTAGGSGLRFDLAARGLTF